MPPSFYASVSNQANSQTAQRPKGRCSFRTPRAGNASPAGAVPKSGVVIGVGGTISGTVYAASTGAGIGSITVEAWEDPPHERAGGVGGHSSDGSYSLVGLLPGPYTLEFTAIGYQDVWYPSAPTEATARS